MDVYTGFIWRSSKLEAVSVMSAEEENNKLWQVHAIEHYTECPKQANPWGHKREQWFPEPGGRQEWEIAGVGTRFPLRIVKCSATM